jgi:hypothetical protein
MHKKFPKQLKISTNKTLAGNTIALQSQTDKLLKSFATVCIIDVSHSFI